MVDYTQLQNIDNRKISVITNFGCRANCWYCVWKKHPQQHTNPPTDWDKLERFLEKYKSKGKVSLSGGGDCLFKYLNHLSWWDNFLKLIKNKHLLLDIHTREKVNLNSQHWIDFFHSINRVVFSSDHLDIVNKNTDNGFNLTDREYLKQLSNLTKVRITHVVTKYTSFGMIEDYIDYTNANSMQFTIKQLVGFDDYGMYQKIVEKYPNLFHLDEGDYNIYFMPDNTETMSFLQ